MRGKFLQTQDIFNKVFQNNSNTLNIKRGFHTTQDYINAVYDASSDALRVNMVGGILPVVSSVSLLPPIAEEGSVCPVVSGGTLSFHQYSDGEWKSLGGTGGGGSSLTPEQAEALDWLVENKDGLTNGLSMTCVVVELKTDGTAVIDGVAQSVSDESDMDGDASTPYRIDVQGYCVGLETYPTETAASSDRYNTKLAFEQSGTSGVTHIYMEREEYGWFASMGNGRNVLKAYCLRNVLDGTTAVKCERITLPSENALTVQIDIQGNPQVIDDDGDLDGDAETLYRIDIEGYVLDTEAYFTNEDRQEQQFMPKSSYDHAANVTHIYLTEEEYETIGGLVEGKNALEVYYLAPNGQQGVRLSAEQMDALDWISENKSSIGGVSMRTFDVSLSADGEVSIDGKTERVEDDGQVCAFSIPGCLLRIEAYEGEEAKACTGLEASTGYDEPSNTTRVAVLREKFYFHASLADGKNIFRATALEA